jgi:regulator of sirC expression with transglutaminase-like and TPR domain
VAQLDELAEKIRPEIEGAESERIRIETFLTSIHDTLGFRVTLNDWSLGDHFLHTVIERRTGLPLNIAILYALLGHRLGLSIQVIGSPIRAMAFTCADGEDLYLDPHHNGSFRLLTRTGAEWFLIRQGLVGVDYDRFLPRLSVTRVIQRNVRNIVNFCDDVNNMEMKSLFQDLIGALSRQRMANELLAHQDATE